MFKSHLLILMFSLSVIFQLLVVIVVVFLVGIRMVVVVDSHGCGNNLKHNCMAAADSAVVLLELDVQCDLARTH